MRIHLLNDIHLEFGKMPRSYRQPECDVVVLAGDIAVGLPGIVWAQETFTVPVIYIPGNHESWGREYREHEHKMRSKAENSNVHFLQNDTVVIDGVRFIGATLWTDFNLYGDYPLAMLAAEKDIGDFAGKISKSARVRFRPQDALTEHHVSKLYLTDKLTEPFDGKTVVVTHHAPSEMSCDEQFRNDPLTPAYASRLENMILDYEPALWLHGHVHVSNDYCIGNTRIVCNPRGYVGHYVNKDFDPELVLEI